MTMTSDSIVRIRRDRSLSVSWSSPEDLASDFEVAAMVAKVLKKDWEETMGGGPFELTLTIGAYSERDRKS